MEQIATTADGQVVMQAVQGVTPQVQVMQMNPTGQVIQGANGQQIMVHAMTQNGQIQVAPAGTQQIQVVPVSALQSGTQGQILLQQPQQAQILQTADGQTFIYHPVALDNSAIQAQAQPTGKIYTRLGSFKLLLNFNVSLILKLLLINIFSIKYQWKLSTNRSSTTSHGNGDGSTYCNFANIPDSRSSNCHYCSSSESNSNDKW